MSGSSSMALCARNALITVYDVTTWSWVNLANPVWGSLTLAPNYTFARSSCFLDKFAPIWLDLICLCMRCTNCRRYINELNIHDRFLASKYQLAQRLFCHLFDFFGISSSRCGQSQRSKNPEVRWRNDRWW